MRGGAVARWKSLSERTRWCVVGAVLCLLVAGGALAVVLAGTGLGEPSPEPPRTTTSLAPETTVTTVAAATTAESVDILVYGSTTSGLAAVRGIKMAAAHLAVDLTVALVSVAEPLESPLVQGLCIEDDYDPGSITGFYQDFRTAVARHYEGAGIWPYERNGRLTYEPEIAQQVLEYLVFNDESLPEDARGRVKVKRLQGVLVSASDSEADRHVVLAGADGTRLRLETRYFVDASVEADLARLLGCRYLMGRSVTVFDDVRGPKPSKPTRADLYAVSPQSLGCLVTLTSGPGAAPSITEREDWPAAQAAHGGRWVMPEDVLETFPTSWSMRHRLPNSKHELNETWSDWADPDIIVRWYLEPEARVGLVEEMRQRILVLLAQVQARYPGIGIDRVPTWPYVRGEVMVLGDYLYSTAELRAKPTQVIATGKYAIFDRHDPVHGSLQPDEAATVALPLDATRPLGHPYLLVSTAYSVDYKAYSSALRMEPTRASVGVVCGVQTALAAARNVPAQAVTYPELREELAAQGYRPER